MGEPQQGLCVADAKRIMADESQPELLRRAAKQIVDMQAQAEHEGELQAPRERILYGRATRPLYSAEAHRNVDITIFTAFSGKHDILAPYLKHLAEIAYPTEKIHLILYDNSNDPSFAKRLRGFLSESRFGRITYTEDKRPPISDEDRRVQTRETNERVASIYTWLAEHAGTETVLIVEHDVLVPANVVAALQRHLTPSKGAVSAHLHGRWQTSTSAAARELRSRDPFELGDRLRPQDQGVSIVGCATFSCLLTYTSLLRKQHVLCGGDDEFFDWNFFRELHVGGYEPGMVWDVVCQHIGGEHDDSETVVDTPPVVSVITAACGRLEYTILTWRSLRKMAGNIPYEHIIGDDGSVDGTRQWLNSVSTRSYFRTRKFFADTKNKEGYSYNRKHALVSKCIRSMAKGDYVLVLDNDIEVRTPDVLGLCVRLWQCLSTESVPAGLLSGFLDGQPYYIPTRRSIVVPVGMPRYTCPQCGHPVGNEMVCAACYRHLKTELVFHADIPYGAFIFMPRHEAAQVCEVDRFWGDAVVRKNWLDRNGLAAYTAEGIRVVHIDGDEQQKILYPSCVEKNAMEVQSRWKAKTM